MKIRITDTEKLQAAIDEAAGKASSFIPSAEDLQAAAENAEEIMADTKLPVALRNGSWMVHTPAGPDTNSYKYGAISLRTMMSRTGSGWFVTGIERCKVYSKNPERVNVGVTEAQAEEIRRRSTAGLTISSKR